MDDPRRTGPTRTGWRKRLPYIAAAVVFVVATWYALAGVDVTLEELEWGPVLLLVAVGVPLLAVLNGEEFRAMAGLLGLRRPFSEGLRVSVLGSAANILPIPGAALVRMAILRRGGASYGDSTQALLLTAACWGGATAVVAGTLLAASGRIVFGGVAALVGLAVWAVAGVLARWRLNTRLRAFLRLLVVEVASVLVGAVRFMLVIMAVSQEVDLEQAAALTVAGVVAAATGIFPGGLGLREVLAGIIGPLVDLSSQLSVLAAVGNRIAEYVVLAPAALLLSRGRASLATIGVQADDLLDEPLDDDLEQGAPHGPGHP